MSSMRDDLVDSYLHFSIRTSDYFFLDFSPSSRFKPSFSQTGKTFLPLHKTKGCSVERVAHLGIISKQC